MCNDPDCGECNRDTKQQFIKAGLELADAIIDVINQKTPKIGDTTQNGFAGYASCQIQAVAFASVVAAMITNLKLEATQDLLLEQIIANTRSLVASLRSERSNAPELTHAPQGTLH
jgi:hypothetical protein